MANLTPKLHFFFSPSPDVNANENLVPSTESQCNMTILKEWKNSCNNHQKSENRVRLEEAQELAKRPWHSKVFKRDRPTLLEKVIFFI